jgi:hypothetical protein
MAELRLITVFGRREKTNDEAILPEEIIPKIAVVASLPRKDNSLCFSAGSNVLKYYLLILA